MKKNHEIKTIESKARLSESMIELHVNSMHHPEKSFNENVSSKDFENISWCAEHSFVEGTIEISFESGNRSLKHLSIPVSTQFLVVCTKEKETGYKVTWSCSLS